MNDKEKVLSQNEIVDLYNRINNGDIEAKRILIECNIRLIGYFAHKYKKLGIEIEDLMSIGKVGLLKGINAYDVSRGVKFSSYVGICILNEIRMALNANNKYYSKVVSLNNFIDDTELPIGGAISGDEEDSYLHYLAKIRSEKVAELLQKLIPAEKEIIMMRFGFNDNKIITQRELGKILGCCRTSISRREAKILKKMGSWKETERLKGLY